MSDRIKLGRYEIIDELGRGGSGIVYRAYDTARNEDVALKVMHPSLVNEPEFIERFRQEAQLSTTISSKHIVPTYDYDVFEGRFYISMELMEGGSLKSILDEKGPYTPQNALPVIQQISAGLSEIHELDIIHRDLKPGNILFDNDGNIKISDLGFAKILDAATSLSKTGEVIGTPSYMSPEIWRGDKISPRSDIYSLACIIVEMLTGRVLFDGESTPEIMLLHYQPAKLSYELPYKWRPCLIKALAIEPDQRYNTVLAFYDDLKKGLSPDADGQSKKKTTWQARPVTGSSPATPLPSRPLFNNTQPQTKAGAGQTPPPSPQFQKPTPPPTTAQNLGRPIKPQSTPARQVPIFTPIQRTTPQQEPSQKEPSTPSAIPVFQPKRSDTPKPAVVANAPHPPKANPPTHPAPVPPPIVPPPVKPKYPETIKKSRKQETRRDKRKREKYENSRTFKPLFVRDETPAPPPPPSRAKAKVEEKEPKVKKESKVKPPKAEKTNKTSFAGGFITFILILGILAIGHFVVSDIVAQKRTAKIQQEATQVAQQTTTVESIKQTQISFTKQTNIRSIKVVTYNASNNSLETYLPAGDETYTNFSFKVNFDNPDDLGSNDNPEHIIGFRSRNEDDGYRLSFYPKTGYWELSLWSGIDNTSLISSDTIATKARRTEPGASNEVQLTAIGNIGYLTINNVYSTTLDLSKRTYSGKIWIATDYNNSARDGYRTRYSDMEISIP